MLTIDGSRGEGGGQILRSSLALSMVTGQPFRIHSIRAGRQRPGLLRQHLTAVAAATAVCNAEVTGATAGSRELEFRPGPCSGGDYQLSVGTAGSTTLVLQTVIPALLVAERPSTLVIEGGTHNPLAPPFEFFSQSYLPLVNRLGPQATAVLERPGFYPAGGGKIRLHIRPAAKLESFDLLTRGPIRSTQATALVAHIPREVAEREIQTLKNLLPWDQSCFSIETRSDSLGPGNVISISIESDIVRETFTGFGERGVRAESIAEGVAREALLYVARDIPIGTHLADQWVLLLALCGHGSFRTLEPSLHTQTQFDVIRAFLDLGCDLHDEGKGSFRIVVGSR